MLNLLVAKNGVFHITNIVYSKKRIGVRTKKLNREPIFHAKELKRLVIVVASAL